MAFGNQDDKTEAPTAKRRSDARKQGQVAKSVELTSVAVLFTVFMALTNFTQGASRILGGYFERVFWNLSDTSMSPQRALQDGSVAIVVLLQALLPILLLALVAGVTINVAQTGFLYAPESLRPNFQKLNPLTGLGNLVSARSFVELFKSVYKIAIIAYFIYSSVRGIYPRLLTMYDMDTTQSVRLLGSLIIQLGLRVAGVMLFLAGLDYAFQRYQHEKRLRMSKEEVKQEHKQMETNPLIKSKIRARQREMAKKRMMDQVPEADVVVTNPTHFAVALKYDAENMGAPIVVAKGMDFLALRIREIAIEADVPIIENPPLARALYRQSDIGDEIPGDLYEAVAELLAFVYEVNQRRRHRMRYGL